jgi:hypothetical protein
MFHKLREIKFVQQKNFIFPLFPKEYLNGMGKRYGSYCKVYLNKEATNNLFPKFKNKI